MRGCAEGAIKPFVFHMCWTAGRVDKLRYLKNMALWFLEPTCDEGSFRAHRAGNDTHAHDQEACCLAGGRPWKFPTPYADALNLASK